MKPIKSEEILPLLLEMLREFDSFCRRNQIQYYAAGGTLLGAIRHHGFIPWDDDIDVFVKESEAEKLLSICGQNPYIDKEKRYKILLPAVAPNVYPTIRLVDTKTVAFEQNVSRKFASGLWIDIFKMAYWPDSIEESKQLFDLQNKLKRWLQISIFGNLKDTKYKLIAPFALPVKALLYLTGRGSNYWSGKLYQLGCKKETGFIGNLGWSSTIKDRYPAEWYDEAIEMPFEDMTIYVPAAYDKILTQFYNDYMQIPPEDKRVRHDFEAYYVD